MVKWKTLKSFIIVLTAGNFYADYYINCFRGISSRYFSLNNTFAKVIQNVSFYYIYVYVYIYIIFTVVIKKMFDEIAVVERRMYCCNIFMSSWITCTYCVVITPQNVLHSKNCIYIYVYVFMYNKRI